MNILMSETHNEDNKQPFELIMPNYADQVNKVTFNFIWDNKIAKIERNTIIGERKNGGLNMIDFTLMNKALKSIWIK